MYEGIEIPQNISAEQAILGAVLLDNGVFQEVRDALEETDFFLEKHKVIYRAMRSSYDDGFPVDLITVNERIDDFSQVGVDYLTELVGSVPSASNVMHYVRIVQDHAVHRYALKSVQDMVSLATAAEDGGDLIAKVQLLASSIADKVTPKTEFVPVRFALETTYEELEQLSQNADSRGITGIESGYPELDRMTAGFQNGDVVIVAARPSVGKTALALNIAQSVGKKTPVAVFSLEMSTSQLIRRMLCAEANIDASRMRTGYFLGDDWERLAMAMSRLSDAKIFIDDTAVISANEIRAKCRRLKKEQGLGLVVIDYLQLIQGHRRGGDNRQQEVSDISRTIKQMAKELDVPVIALSQLSRGVEQRQDKRPMMSDLRESGSIEQDADIVAFLYRDDYYNQESEKKNIIEIIIAKQRNGPVGTVELVFLKNFNKFVSLNTETNFRPDHEPDKRVAWA